MKTKLKFYDLKKKKAFTSTNYKVTSKKTKKGIRYFAITKAPSGVPSYRILSKEQYGRLK